MCKQLNLILIIFRVRTAIIWFSDKQISKRYHSCPQPARSNPHYYRKEMALLRKTACLCQCICAYIHVCVMSRDIQHASSNYSWIPGSVTQTVQPYSCQNLRVHLNTSPFICQVTIKHQTSDSPFNKLPNLSFKSSSTKYQSLMQ